MVSLLLRAFPRTAMAARPSSSAAARVVAVRPFSMSTARFLKESNLDNPQDNEKHKQDQLQKQREGRGHWKPELASDSEEAVAADRHEHNDHSEEGMKELQDKTAKIAEEKRK